MIGSTLTGLFILVFFISPIVAFRCDPGTKIKCDGHGQCSSDGTECICDSGYATSFKDSYNSHNSYMQCSYAQKTQQTAIILQVFIGYVGAAHFYVGNAVLGIFALMTFIFSIISPFCLEHCCIEPCCPKCLPRQSEDRKSVVDGCKYTFRAIIILWWLIDIIIFSLNKYTDGNHVELKST